MISKTTRWDAADTLETKEDIAAYLDAVLEDGDPDLLKAHSATSLAPRA
jgi:DNA-binding phage protein